MEIKNKFSAKTWTIITVLFIFLFMKTTYSYYKEYKEKEIERANVKEKITVKLDTAEQDEAANWKIYSDSKYNFEIRFPNDWADPIESQPSNSKANYLSWITFSEQNVNGANNGFSIYIYDSKKHLSPGDTENLSPRDPETFKINDCANYKFDDAVIGEENYLSTEVNVSDDDKCFQKAFFYSATNNNYVYNIIPFSKAENNYSIGDYKSKTILTFPKFFEIISTFKLLPKTQEENKIASPTVKSNPTQTRKATKRIFIPTGTCLHKHDHPRKSRQHKGRHMDEDCCMDPDEWPNPRCRY